jgi:hypothetical protein
MNNEGSIGSVRLLGPIDGLVNARVAEAYLLYDLCDVTQREVVLRKYDRRRCHHVSLSRIGRVQVVY